MKKLYAAKSWKMLPHIDRVYVNGKARRELDWKPRMISLISWSAWGTIKISEVILLCKRAVKATIAEHLPMAPSLLPTTIFNFQE